MGNLAVENSVVDGRIRAFRFLPGRPGDFPSMNFRGYEDTGIWYDTEAKAIKFRFDGTDAYTFDDTGGLTVTTTYNFSGEDSITAFATGGQASATALSASKTLHRISVCATAGDSVKLPAATAGQVHYVRNDGAAQAQVFGTSPDTIDGVATGTGIAMAAGMSAWFFCITAGQWVTSPVRNFTATSTLAVMPAGTTYFYVNQGNGVKLQTSIALGWTAGDANAAFDLTLFRDNANKLAQRNGTNAQEFLLYETFTDASNYRRIRFLASSGTATIQADAAGSGGSSQNMTLQAGGLIQFNSGGSTGRWQVDSSGHFVPVTDVAVNVGNSTHFAADGYIRRRIGKIASVTYSASMTPDASLGEFQEIVVTNGTAFTINAPTNPVTGQSMNVKIKNTSGGAAGAATWNAVFKMATWTNPANGFSRCIEFYYDGTIWLEYGRCTADVPN